MEIIKSISIPTVGTGRRDYSTNVETAVVPITRSHQYRTQASFPYNLTPYWFLSIANEPIYGSITVKVDLPATYDFTMYYFRVELDSNVLIKSYCGLYNNYTGVFDTQQVKFGYGELIFEIPKGWLLPKTDRPELVPAISFLPGGYLTRITASFMEERLAISG